MRIGALRIETLALPHDAPQIALRFQYKGAVVGLVTDLGHVPDELAAFLAPCRTVLLESNHDLDMLRGGAYPETLKRRIAGPLGHLSNAQTAALIKNLGRGVERIVLMHLSKNNNRPKLAVEAARRALASRPGVELLVASQEGPLVIDTAAPAAQLRLQL